MYYGALLGLAAGLTAWWLTRPAAALAYLLGAIDRPGPRRVNLIPVPRLGGIAVAGALMGGIVLCAVCCPQLWDQLHGRGWAVMAAASTLVFMAGLTDDLYSLGIWSRLTIELFAAIAVSIFFVRLCPGQGLGDLALLSVPSALWLVAVCNGSNLIDGLDGLAAGIAVLEIVGLAIVAAATRQTAELTILALAGGAWGGFWLRNRYPAWIFSGDGGALLAGFGIGALALRTTGFCSGWIRLEAASLIMAYPVLEVASSVARRTVGALAVRPPAIAKWRVAAGALFVPDRAHIHHRLLKRGFPHAVAVAICQAMAAIMVSLGVLTALRPGAALAAAGLAILSIVGFGCLLNEEFSLRMGRNRLAARAQVPQS